MAVRAQTDIERLLRHAARNAVEGLAAKRQPVHPARLAERVVDAHFHLAPVRAHRAEWVAAIADYVRELRAVGEERSS